MFHTNIYLTSFFLKLRVLEMANTDDIVLPRTYESCRLQCPPLSTHTSNAGLSLVSRSTSSSWDAFTCCDIVISFSNDSCAWRNSRIPFLDSWHIVGQLRLCRPRTVAQSLGAPPNNGRPLRQVIPPACRCFPRIEELLPYWYLLAAMWARVL